MTACATRTLTRCFKCLGRLGVAPERRITHRRACRATMPTTMASLKCSRRGRSRHHDRTPAPRRASPRSSDAPRWRTAMTMAMMRSTCPLVLRRKKRRKRMGMTRMSIPTSSRQRPFRSASRLPRMPESRAVRQQSRRLLLRRRRLRRNRNGLAVRLRPRRPLRAQALLTLRRNRRPRCRARARARSSRSSSRRRATDCMTFRT